MAFLRIAITLQLLLWSMIFSDLASPAEASGHTMNRTKGFAQA
jgi:hypothetical protein